MFKQLLLYFTSSFYLYLFVILSGTYIPLNVKTVGTVLLLILQLPYYSSFTFITYVTSVLQLHKRYKVFKSLLREQFSKSICWYLLRK